MVQFQVSIDEHAEAHSVVSVRGEVDLHTAPKVEDAISRASDASETVVVDLGGITFMDSTALSTFMRSGDALKKKGVAMRLAAPSGAVERIFSVTGFGDYFEVFPSREAAISG